ncbi:MAG: hypothetical protein HOP10_03070 [Chitinophagaceae bacterium]|nr:hypothetical protein [Chitinophagaceae bacterium]
MENLLSKVQEAPRILIQIAIEADKSRTLTNNQTLVTSLQVLSEFREFCKIESTKERSRALNEYLQSDISESKFLFLTGSLLRKIDNVIVSKIKTKEEEKYPFISDYDSLILEAVGQTCSDIMWRKEEQKINGYQGPAVGDCLDRFENQELDTIWTLFFRNYLANLLVHYLAVSRVRIGARLPKDIEYVMREEDATFMALYISRNFDHKVFSQQAMDDIIESFRNMMIELF